MADVITRIKVESSEYDAKIKRAAQGLQQMETACRKVGGTLAVLEKDELEFVRSLGKMETVSKTARGRLGELTTAFTDLRAQYNRLTQEEKNGDFGRALNSSLEQLKVRIKETKTELAGIQRELNGGQFGQFGSIIDGIGQKMGINANLTELLTSKTALMSAGIGASVAIIGKATQEWAKYNTELARQDQITTVTTGVKGPGADRMTDQARAMVDTYGVDFREAISAANTLMTQFGKSGEEAMDLIRQGMQGMIQGDGPKLLSMIQQYAPSFRDAGIEASQLVAIIQNSEGGIFTDQNMNAIVMGIKNIRLMTNSTAEALGKLGIDGQEMTRKLNDGTMTIFEPMQQVSQAINGAGSASQAAGEVMQQVFGRQGAAAGTKLGEAIATLNTNLKKTKRQTGELGDAYNDLYEANVKLNGAIRDCFEYDGWDQMATGIKANLISALASVVGWLGKIKDGVAGILGKAPISQLQASEANGGGEYIDRAVNRLGQWKTQKGAMAMRNAQMNSYDRLAADINIRISEIERALQSNGVSSHGEANSISRTLTDLRNRLEAVKQNQREYDRRAQSVINSIGKGNTADTGTVITEPKTPKTTTPAQRAAENIKAAEQEYSRALEKAALEVDNGRATTADAKKAEYNATMALWTAYSKAADTVPSNEGYRQRMTELEASIKTLGGEVTQSAEAQKKAQEAARELAQKQKNLAQATAAAATAQQDNDLKAFYQAQAKAVQNGGTAQQAVGFTTTTANIDAFIGNLKERISQSDVGTDLYNNLTKQLADTTALSNLLQVAIKNGIDPEQIGLNPQEFWGKVFGENPGDYIKDGTWQDIVEKMNAYLKKKGIKINIDTNTGGTSGKKDDINTISEISKMSGGISSLVSGVQQLGIEIPRGISDTINVLQGITTILTAIQTISTIKFWAGGGVVHAASGLMVPGNNYSGDLVPSMINSGELILNRAQQGVLAEELQGGGGQGVPMQPYVSGEYVFLGVSNHLKRSGQGEIVTTSMLKRMGLM